MEFIVLVDLSFLDKNPTLKRANPVYKGFKHLV